MLAAPLLLITEVKHTMKLPAMLSSSVVLIIPVFLLLVLACSPSKENAAAVVNGEFITKVDLQLSLDNMLNQYAKMGMELNPARTDTLRTKILDSMISAELLYQESQKAGFQVTEEEVSNEIELMKKQYPSEEIYQEGLVQQGITEEQISVQIMRNLTIRKFVDERITAGIVITEEEKSDYYETNKARYEHDDEVAARHIVLDVTESTPPETLEIKRALLMELRSRVEAGEDFAKLASEYSQGPTRTQGGDLGFFSRGKMVPPFEEAAFALKPGEMSDVIRSGFGFHLIQVYDARPAGKESYEEVEESIEEILRRPKINAEMEKIVEELRAQSTIEILL
jgi:peptidyl-prolyl cis-trans isomerase C